MKILGNRVLVSRIEEPKAEGFTTVEVQDSFVYKGRVEDIGFVIPSGIELKVGDVLLFAKYSPDTQDVEIEGKMMKIINTNDILAVL